MIGENEDNLKCLKIKDNLEVFESAKMVKEHSLETVVQDLENELKIKGDHFHFSLAGFDVRGYIWCLLDL